MSNYNGEFLGDGDDSRLTEANNKYRTRTDEILKSGADNLNKHMEELCNSLGLSMEMILEQDEPVLQNEEKEIEDK